VEAVNLRGIELRHSCGVLGVAQDATGVTVELEDGTAMRCHVLIGADGIHSKVRECIFPDLLVERSSKAYFGCGALMPLSCLSPEEIDELRLTEGSFNMINGPNGFAGFIGIGSPEAAQEPKFMFWTHIAESLVDDSFDFKNMSSVKETLQRLRHGWCRPVATAISLLDQNVPGVEAMCGPIFSLRPIPEWSNGRVVLIGDAAHGYGPGAQGAALAMEDARLLALQLKSCENETEALNRVFRNFETKRRSRVERIGNAAEARNSDRLGVSPWWKTKLREYVMMGLHSWYRNGYFLAEYAYRVEEDL
jgi:2-polyprenyl-6-methoxyphenol hydroxylase-like FAD-dependent oxidoreductase